MEENTQGRKEAVSIAGHNVRFEYDPEVVKAIARNCDSKSVKQSVSYLGCLAFRGNITCAIVDEVAFFAGTFCKKHFRLVEIAVQKEDQGKGYGRYMITLMKRMCAKKGLNKITFRTSQSETAREFYEKQGGVVTGTKDGDFEMEIVF